jgi:hypothetical protein
VGAGCLLLLLGDAGFLVVRGHAVVVNDRDQAGHGVLLLEAAAGASAGFQVGDAPAEKEWVI